MTYVVTETCIKCKYTDCVDVCPVDCFREGPNMLVIDPDECIDCTLCVAECPVEAIFAEDDVPDTQREFIQMNAELAKVWKPIIEKKDADNIYYAARVGTSPPRPEHDKLESREALVKAVTELAAEAPAKQPPEVRIACRKELPRERVYEVRRDLQPLKKADKINSFTATVLEAPKK